MASLDLDGLFTNVPIDKTIELIFDKVYRDDYDETIDIADEALRRLFQICTTRGYMYCHCHDVAMGSPFGVILPIFT